jgi:hypothetical protein
MYTLITETTRIQSESIPEDFTWRAINEYGDIFWLKDGKSHRDDDEPAVVPADGTKFWYKEGVSHREKGLPAEIWTNGTKYWYVNDILTGKFHSQ